MTIHVSRDDSLTTITIDRPHRRNAIDPEAAVALRSAFENFEADDAAKVAVLTGAGGVFCAGFDLTAVDSFQYDPHAPGPMGPTRMMFSKPVIAAVEGHAVAGGLELALMCDLRVASSSAVFGVFCRRWGVPLIDGGTVRLPRIIGQGRALDMILTGRPVFADEALAMGLANRITAPGEALPTALALARILSAFPQRCMNADRKSCYTQWDSDVAQALNAEALGGVVPLRVEAVEGAKRFVGGAGRGGAFAN